jgi:UDP-N-acetylmuramoylalanine--D-glutamate ligase
LPFLQSYIQGKKAVVLGAGRSGIAAAKLLARHNVEVFASESCSVQENPLAADELKKASIPFEFEGHSTLIFDADFWIISPGIPLNTQIVQKAQKKGISIFGELEAASWFCRSPIVAITGSNGKSTVTSLLGEIFREAGVPCIVAGNIGYPFSDSVDETIPEGVAVLEVSSFQLETIRGFHPHVAVILNLTPDHLDRHGDMETYANIKSRIFKNQNVSDYLVYNNRDSLVSRIAQKAKSQKVSFGQRESTRKTAFTKDGNLVISIHKNEELILAFNEMKIRGPHNEDNALASSLAAQLMGVDAVPLRCALRNFSGLPHRMERICERKGVEWINDSKATNVDSVWYALSSFQKPIILIAGGRDKDSDFSSLRERVKEKTKAVILIGEAALKIIQAWEGTRPLYHAGSLKEAVEKADEIAQSGDVVMLSPACASFDMFENFEDRGDQFKNFVHNL